MWRVSTMFVEVLGSLGHGSLLEEAGKQWHVLEGYHFVPRLFLMVGFQSAMKWAVWTTCHYHHGVELVNVDWTIATWEENSFLPWRWFFTRVGHFDITVPRTPSFYGSKLNVHLEFKVFIPSVQHPQVEKRCSFSVKPLSSHTILWTNGREPQVCVRQGKLYLLQLALHWSKWLGWLCWVRVTPGHQAWGTSSCFPPVKQIFWKAVLLNLLELADK